MKKNNLSERDYPIRYALISVSDKTNIVEFALELHNRKIKILATSGTACLLAKSGIPVIEISNYTGFPEILDGRVKTLNTKIYTGILYRRGIDDKIIEHYKIFPIDILIVNFYPFKQTIMHQDCLLEEAIEKVDIGGPTMVCSAAKNYKFVSVIVNHKDYNDVLDELNTNNNYLSLNTRFKLAMKAFNYLAFDKIDIANYFNQLTSKLGNVKKHDDILPEKININLVKKQNMIYGENIHQNAALYTPELTNQEFSSNLLKVQGEKLSYNNFIDIDTAIECLEEFTEPTCVIIKHSNPCGVATANSISYAYKRAYISDTISAFGGVIALNRELDQSTIELIIKNQFVEIIAVPSVSDIALKIISKKKKIKLIVYPKFKKNPLLMDFKNVNNGEMLVQEHNYKKLDINKLSIVSKNQPNKQEIKDSIFCWKVSKFVKSNAIVCARNSATIGIGAGQMSRIDSVKIAYMKAKNAGLETENSVMASDAFFPFRDSIDIAAKMGVKCIIQPGGSIRDQEIIDAANEYNISMIFTEIRNFRH
ncbi:bifunctional phosphoribosylaminoimidazolecarboxamide formyltransferase/inosine monophosphate cyclohydrolase [Candidatus Pantoea edessiphila]|uniref:Bifunctional purine biosynthesis protein PurH n=1 Tax=Candidatus Pantoea edessiphila TaxID=2044610 RepID=A0A2P5SYD1_9GAMM|nr:bifunctional phosphoribosylaminoimidazolecarboxamide formyltransferase/IMP cyclohydrolase [Candidatus Pantoea edessiphila]MBK4775541.1 bifunctional phosphoribosylaminoimidazolecarboxamide formyltransferase/IMP cyclohydrolase [Pantoea sp. Edef]PPI87335.1 bifunctional phosphoribosylaminoimidazolecarboxamide formyltransferase/inosine monophosphate cyclohydrolase [Candidatus Pantoea edessiphila]